MSIVYLQPSAFYVSPSNDLATRIPKFSLVFFSSAKCIYCKDVLPAFINVSSVIRGCTFAIMDVDQDSRKIVKMSESTRLPITLVPFIVMYVNGNPVDVFEPDENNPAANTDLLKKFIIYNANAVKSGTKHVSDKKVCDTSIGMAICGKKVCYIKDRDAYKTS